MTSTSQPLTLRHCTPVRSGEDALDPSQMDGYLALLEGWTLRGGSLEKRFSFPSFPEMAVFLQAVAWISLTQDHHPDVEAGYDSCTLRYTTHSIGGLTDNDVICAARVNHLFD